MSCFAGLTASAPVAAGIADRGKGRGSRNPGFGSDGECAVLEFEDAACATSDFQVACMPTSQKRGMQAVQPIGCVNLSNEWRLQSA